VNVRQTLLAFLVFVLSGVPATAVVCDLMWCERTPVETAGCHDHPSSSDVWDVVAPGDSCSHFSVVTPFVSPGHRHLTVSAVALAVVEVSLREPALTTPGADLVVTHGPPRPALAAQFQPLRI
jgi:hypothetical protein